MSDFSNSDDAPEPVSLLTVLFLVALSGLFVVFVRHYYTPTPASPQNSVAENLPKDLEWKSNPASRRKTLADLRTEQQAQGNAYGWVDQKAGVVRLPVDRAIDLTARQYGSKQ